MKRSLFLLLTVLLCTNSVICQRIDRKVVVTRNNPIVSKVDTLGSLTVGNGSFATTVDVTGLQSYPERYFNGVPLCSQSDWGWHSFPNIQNLSPEETQKKIDLGHKRDEVFAVEYKNEGRNKQATDYFRVNPHRLNLGNIGFEFGKNHDVSLEDIESINQTLNLYDGVINSCFRVKGESVAVNTAVLPNSSTLFFNVNTSLFKKGEAKLCFRLPYVTGKHADAATDFEQNEKHKSEVIAKTHSMITIKHSIDATTYYVKLSWKGNARFVDDSYCHTYYILPSSDMISVCVEYSSTEESLHKTFDYKKSLAETKLFWNSWWNEGGIIDFSECVDPRAKELERRVVLSQYLTYINCANQTPAQETGLTYNSWFGRPHLEMTWWHTVDFSLWNRPKVLETILEWYNDKAYPEAKKIAKRQNFKGVRWMKMTDPWVGESPSNVGSFLTWQQPHYIYMAEEMYRRNPSDETIVKYARYVEETAEFMADFALACSVDDKSPICLFGQTSMQESMSKDFSYNHPFEQVYWVYGLTTAQKWRERQGKERHPLWDEIIKRMGNLPGHDGIYTAGDPLRPFVDSETTSSFDPFNYATNTISKQISEEDFRLKSRSDHPAVLGACGLLPYYGQYDRAQMQRTLVWVIKNWNWDTTWGWDYGMTAMCAARLGDGENAINALLIDKGKNTYLVSGHNYQEPKRLRLYLPGNGALLDAVAMMCAGWDGCPNIKNPGFPQNGKWNVKWEGLNKMQ